MRNSPFIVVSCKYTLRRMKKKSSYFCSIEIWENGELPDLCCCQGISTTFFPILAFSALTLFKVHIKRYVHKLTDMHEQVFVTYLQKTFIYRCKTIHTSTCTRITSRRIQRERDGKKNLLDLKSNKKKMQFLFRQMRFSISTERFSFTRSFMRAIRSDEREIFRGYANLT
jgi:hypothetical protein